MKTRASLVLLGLAVSVAGIIIFSMQAYGQESYNIPSWIKNNAKWWSEGQIGDSDFVKGIQYMIDNNILHVSAPSQTTSNTASTNETPQVTTDKQTYHVGDEIKISGSGFDKGRLEIVIDYQYSRGQDDNVIILWQSYFAIPEDQKWGSTRPYIGHDFSAPVSFVDVDGSGEWNAVFAKYAVVSFSENSPFRETLDGDGHIVYTLSTLPEGRYEITAFQESHPQQIHVFDSKQTEDGDLIFKEAHNYFQIK